MDTHSIIMISAVVLALAVAVAALIISAHRAKEAQRRLDEAAASVQIADMLAKAANALNGIDDSEEENTTELR